MDRSLKRTDVTDTADYDALTEEGRRLASQRDDLIAQGVDPADLAVPLAPHRCPDCSAPRIDGVFGEGVIPPAKGDS